MKASSGHIVKVHYTGKFTDNTLFDSSVDAEPLEFQLGQGMMIPGFEAAVLGMEVGQAKQGVLIPAAEAYGPVNPEMMFEVPMNELPPATTVGTQLQAEAGNGQVIPVTVAEVNGDVAVIDANHPLAGKDLVFDIELVSITPSAD
ncbi:FKBP-type peptidyl-prolyl cis-trans isomerase [Eisenibacter elegans]|jgi:peptidylprolyl isomerase|uniref:FKBP-type peptidyl-prolyl cis-trans isomerase n=1 Tax=Eisenibacter elegans TaxID=997 RepID=UPI0003FBAF1C|nr:peptidylprolyl isomerase [Eisenibacter elegans]